MEHLKATEIRVGNLVSFNGDIIRLDGSLLAMYLQNELDKPFYPIPLTEELLLKFGFKKIEDYRTAFIKRLSFGQISGLLVDGQVTMWYNYNGTSIVNDIKYVHQLQNLYYVLTRSELQFNK